MANLRDEGREMKNEEGRMKNERGEKPWITGRMMG